MTHKYYQTGFFLILQNFQIFGKSLIQNECITKIANCGWPQKMNFWASKPVKFKFLATKPVFSFVFTKIEFSDHHNLEMSDDVMLWNFPRGISKFFRDPLNQKARGRPMRGAWRGRQGRQGRRRSSLACSDESWTRTNLHLKVIERSTLRNFRIFRTQNFSAD